MHKLSDQWDNCLEARLCSETVFGIVQACSIPSVMSVWLFVTLWTVALQAPLSVGFSREEFQSGLPLPPPGDLPNPGIEPTSPALAGGFFTTGLSYWGQKKYLGKGEDA